MNAAAAPGHTRRVSVVNWILALAAVTMIGCALVQLHRARAGVRATILDVQGTPVTIYRPANHPRAPVILIAHGFAGSQQLMQSFALTFARSGYIAVTFDFPGHGMAAIRRR